MQYVSQENGKTIYFPTKKTIGNWVRSPRVTSYHIPAMQTTSYAVQRGQDNNIIHHDTGVSCFE